MVYAYMRCSTASQMEKNGLQMQESEINKYCLENGIEISDTFVDEGVSGTKEDRDGLFELIQSMKKGDKVIVQNTSRLWRADSVKVFIHKEFKRKGCDIISVENPGYSLYNTDPNDFLFNSIMEILDQYDRMTIAMKLKKGRQAKAKKGGKPCGVLPYGYKWDGNSVIIDSSKAYFVELMYKDFVEHGSISRIKKILDDMEIRTNRGKIFSIQGIKNILTNDFYTGILTYAESKIVGEHKAIIDNEMFNEVQRVMKG